MKNPKIPIYILGLFVIFALLTSCFFRPRFYSAKPIEAWVVDEDTGKPLEDVVAIAQWELYGGMQPHSVGYLKVMETVTDRNGRFYFPAWGPKTTFKGYLRNAPRITFFKSGYEWGSFSNVYHESISGDGGPVRSSRWHGKTIELKKFQGNLEEYADQLEGFNSTLEYKFRTQNSECQWKKIPYMVVALHKQKITFNKHKINNQLNSIEGLAKMSPKYCGQSQSFFRSYM